MKKKIIALDLDGSALNNQSTLSQRTIATLKRAEAAGHVVMIATGRPNRISENFYRDLHLTSPMVNFNGGLVHKPGQHWVGEKNATIPRDLVFDVIKLKQDLPIKMMAAEGKNWLLADHLVDIGFDFFPAQLKTNQVLTAKSLQTDPTSLTIFIDNDDQKWIKENLEQKYENIEMNSWGGSTPALEIVQKGITKFSGVSYVAQQYNVDNQDIMAFGDEYNDIPMLSQVGQGIAMANAQPAVKAVARDITPLTNEEDGIADYLEKHLAI